MAKKTKELEDEQKKATTTKKAATTKKTTATKKAATAKKTTATEKVATLKKATATKKAATAKKTTATKKVATTKKTTTTKKAAMAKKATSTRSKSEVKTSKQVIEEFQTEYYDLPYAYNRTVVKILAQTPKTLFVYWEISEDDRNKFIKTYGERFFEETKPVLIVYNNTMNYSFEIDINDFANSWYIHINDSNCNYVVELGRKPLPFANSHILPESSETQYIPYYVYVSSSNRMEVPNNRILYDFTMQFIPFRNIKTGEIIHKDINQFKFYTNFGIMTISQLYEYLYSDEKFEYENFIGNPSSGLTSSGTFSSRSKLV